MPHSLRAKIKGLRYKGIITDKDCDRLCKALDTEDVLDKIRAEICDIRYSGGLPTAEICGYIKCLEIIDKHIAERSDKE